RSTIAVAVAGLVAMAAAASQRAPARPCLHGSPEAPEQAARRRAALNLAREVNTTEAKAKIQGNTYYVLSDLPGLASEVDGFKVQLSTDGVSYAFSVKDTLDACRFAYFSDQDGLIYSATPIQ